MPKCLQVSYRHYHLSHVKATAAVLPEARRRVSPKLTSNSNTTKEPAYLYHHPVLGGWGG